MAIHLHMHPELTAMSRSHFREIAPPYSIAIDGFVGEAPWFNPHGPYANFNHHEGVDRLSTRATCAQVLMALRMGMLECFTKDGEPEIHVYANDCDEDVCLTWAVLRHINIALRPTSIGMNRMVGMMDMLDTTAGSYPYPPKLPLLEEKVWIFDPYRRFRLDGGLGRRCPDEFRAVVEEVNRRFDLYLEDRGERMKVDDRYEKLGGGPGWTMFREIGTDGRTGAFADGVKAYVCLVEERSNGRYTYSIGKLSQYVTHFPIQRLYYDLNLLEDCGEDRWGGGETIGGSPRVGGSKIPPTELIELINSLLEDYQAGF